MRCRSDWKNGLLIAVLICLAAVLLSIPFLGFGTKQGLTRHECNQARMVMQGYQRCLWDLDCHFNADDYARFERELRTVEVCDELRM